MPVIQKHKEGHPCWADLNSIDAELTKKFYTDLFGWSADDVPIDDGVYTMYSKNGELVTGADQIPTGMKGVPSHWSLYFNTYDLEAAVERVTANGGKVTAPISDVMDLGRLAFAEDPQGAAFCLWEPKSHKGAGIMDEDDTLVWFELTTDDRLAAETFYKKVLMVDSMTMLMEKGEDYTVLGGEQNPIGGILAKTPAMDEGIPNYWGIYFRTDTLDESIKRAAELGAEIVLPRTSLGEQGYMAVLKDPTGAHFSLHMSKSSG